MADRWLALLRGVNVGGRNKLPMADLREALAAEGFADVATYIQSGNIALKHEGPPKAIAGALDDLLRAKFGVVSTILVTTPSAIEAILAALPFKGDPSRIYVYLCIDPNPPTPDLSALNAQKMPEEALAWLGNALAFHAPDGMSQSKIASKIEGALPGPATMRNQRTLEKLCALGAG